VIADNMRGAIQAAQRAVDAWARMK
jgi:hypothetical protein